MVICVDAKYCSQKCTLEYPNEQWSQGLPEKTPNSEAKPVSDQDDLEALAAEVLDEPSDATLMGDVVDAEVVPNAEVIVEGQSDVVAGEVVQPSERSYLDKPPRAYVTPPEPVDPKQRKLQTKGGAVAGVLLGALSIAGAFLTSYSLINALLGLALSAWGFSSSANKLARTGLILSTIGIVLSIVLGGTP